MPASSLIIGDCVSYTGVFFYITPMSCHICQINSIYRFREITTLSCRVRFVLIHMPLLHHMYHFILCGCLRNCEAKEGKVTDSVVTFLFIRYLPCVISLPIFIHILKIISGAEGRHHVKGALLMFCILKDVRSVV